MSWLPHPADGQAWVAPSVLAADFAHLRTDLQDMSEAGAQLFHLDVMDGHFVPNISFGPAICGTMRGQTDLPLDAHLMLTHPDQYLDQFARAGMDAITIHVEAAADLGETLQRIGELGCQRGLSLNPDTPLDDVLPWLPLVDLVLVMSVQPGFGGQKFNPVALDKIAALKERRQTEGLEYLVSVDGGINGETGPRCRAAGADILVSGSWLFRAGDRAGGIAALRG